VQGLPSSKAISY